jgi:hypothetical protein
MVLYPLVATMAFPRAEMWAGDGAKSDVASSGTAFQVEGHDGPAKRACIARVAVSRGRNQALRIRCEWALFDLRKSSMKKDLDMLNPLVT